MGDGDLAFAWLVARFVKDNLGHAIDVALIQFGLFPVHRPPAPSGRGQQAELQPVIPESGSDMAQGQARGQQPRLQQQPASEDAVKKVTFIAELAPLRQLAAKNPSHQRDRHDCKICRKRRHDPAKSRIWRLAVPVHLSSSNRRRNRAAAATIETLGWVRLLGVTRATAPSNQPSNSAFNRSLTTTGAALAGHGAHDLADEEAEQFVPCRCDIRPPCRGWRPSLP